MWNFKLKKTRIIFLISVVWCALAYFLSKGGLVFLIDRQNYYSYLNFGLYDSNLFSWLLLISPVLIYWTIPLIRGVFRWVKGGE